MLDLQSLYSLPSLPPAPPLSTEDDYDREIRGLRAAVKQIPLNKAFAESPAQVNAVLDVGNLCYHQQAWNETGN